MLDMEKPGVKNAVTANTTAPTSSLIINCPILKRCVFSTFSATLITSFQRTSIKIAVNTIIYFLLPDYSNTLALFVYLLANI